MSYTYEQRKKQNSEKNGMEPSVSSWEESVLPNSAQLSQMGHQVGMPEVMREKMENSFGMDLSSVKLYENKAVGDAGAEAVAQGSKISFAPGKLDFSSTSGQELLGHEISHVASQARGEVQRSGFVNDAALEARADKEGSMAARGERITAGYGGATAPLSSASAASAAAPMQAKSGKQEERPKFKNINLLQNNEPRRRWGYGKRFWNWLRFGLFGKSTGLDNSKNVVNARMEQDMKNMIKIDDDDENVNNPIDIVDNPIDIIDDEPEKLIDVDNESVKKKIDEDDLDVSSVYD